MFGYAAQFYGGTTVGERVAVQADLAVSHQLLIVGLQASIYFSRLFSMMPGIKYPIVFKAIKLQNLRITIGISSRL